jgi:hypothetical protein
MTPAAWCCNAAPTDNTAGVYEQLFVDAFSLSTRMCGYVLLQPFQMRSKARAWRLDITPLFRRLLQAAVLVFYIAGYSSDHPGTRAPAHELFSTVITDA